MAKAELTEAEAIYLERVVEDCAGVLGSGIELRDVELNDEDEVVLRMSYRLGAEEWTTEGRGETVVAAHAALRDQLVLDRIRVGLRAFFRQYR